MTGIAAAVAVEKGFAQNIMEIIKFVTICSDIWGAKLTTLKEALWGVKLARDFKTGWHPPPAQKLIENIINANHWQKRHE
jgi:hypothetical protein